MTIINYLTSLQHPHSRSHCTKWIKYIQPKRTPHIQCFLSNPNSDFSTDPMCLNCLSLNTKAGNWTLLKNTFTPFSCPQVKIICIYVWHNQNNLPGLEHISPLKKHKWINWMLQNEKNTYRARCVAVMLVKSTPLFPLHFSVQLLHHKMGHPDFTLQLIHVISNLNGSGQQLWLQWWES